jgi:hypothetical protein
LRMAKRRAKGLKGDGDDGPGEDEGG